MDSRGNIIFSLELFDGTSYVKVMAFDYIVSFKMTIVSNSALTGDFELFDHDEILDNFFKNVPVDKRTMRISWAYARDFEKGSVPVFEVNVVYLVPKYLFNGIRFTGQFCSGSRFRSLKNRQTAFGIKEGTLHSDAFRQLADLAEWNTKSLGGGSNAPSQDLVEETQTKLEVPLSASGESFENVISKSLIPSSRNKDGNGGYLFYFDQDARVHFHTPGFLSQVTHEFEFARSVDGNVISFEPISDDVFSAVYGGENANYRNLNSETREEKHNDSDKSTVPGGGSAEVVTDANRVMADSNKGVATKHFVHSGSDEEAKNIAINRYTFAKRVLYQAKAEIRGQHGLYVGNFIKIIYKKKNGTIHPLSGTFQLFGVEHSIQGGQWIVSLNMCRTASLEGDTVVG